MKLPRQTPRITVVTPSYNQAPFIDQTIRSVIDQENCDAQYFVLDGGSTDGSRTIIKKHEESIDFWRSSPDKGQSSAIIEGFERADGDVVCWLNSDDVLLPGALEYVSNYFGDNPDVDVLLGGIMYSDQKGLIKKCYLYPNPRKFYASRGITAFGQQSMFFRKRIFSRIGTLNSELDYLMDTDLVHRMIFKGISFGTSRKYLAVFRWHDDMKSTDGSLQKKNETSNLLTNYVPKIEQQAIAKYLFRTEQILNGNYLCSAFHTWKARHTTIEGIWRRYEVLKNE